MEYLLIWIALVIIVTGFNFSIRSNEEDMNTEKESLFRNRPPLTFIDKLKLKWKFEWKHLPRDIKVGITNLIKWFNLIWNDRDWDRSYALKIMIFKIRNMANYHEDKQRYVGWEDNVKWMRTCAKLLDRVDTEYYSAEFSSYYDIDILLDKEADERGFVEMHTEIENERFDEYFEKYPREREIALQEHPNLDLSTLDGKKNLGFWISHRLQNKARRLAFKIMEEHIEKWWD